MTFPYEGLFAQLPTWSTVTGNGAQLKICCPFHKEKTPSMSINLETGEWYCFGKCDEGGGPQVLVERLGLQPPAGMDEKKPAAKRKKKDAPPIPAPKVEEFHQRLLNLPEQMAIFERTCNINRGTIERFKVGWTGKRYVFPVYDEAENCRNLRLYLYGGDSTNKVYHYSEGEGEEKITWGGTRLFPLQAILESKDDYVLLCEGEKDALNACQLGFPAVSVTGGAGSWDTSLNKFFKNKYVFIMYDIDDKGTQGAEKIRRALNKIAKGVAVLTIPKEGLPTNGDLTDWIMAGATRDSVASLIADARGQFERRDKPERLDTLGAANSPAYNDRLIEVEAHVVGRETTAYTALRGQTLTCPQSRGKACFGCALNDAEGEMQVIIPADDKEVMYLVERTDKQIRARIEDKFGIANGCHLWNAEPNLEHKSLVEKVLLSTTVDQRTWGDTGAAAEFSQQLAYVVDTKLESNLAYTLVGRMVTHPDDQSNRLIVTQARSTRLSLDTFEITPELHEELRFFQPAAPDADAIIERLGKRWEDLAQNVTHILRRPRVHAAVDVVAHSLLRFYAWGSPLVRGWVEGYVGGDTRQGKSVVAQTLHAHYRAGEFAVLEVASLAGILGGAQKIGNGEFMVSWGKAPLNDRGWVTWDECQNIPLNVMASLSGMRSSGIAELDKIKQEKVYARTRQLWLSNPRQDGVTVDQISQGIMLVPDVFGRPEDQARLDFATIVRSNDVDVYDALRESVTGAIAHSHTTELCHALLMFSWSRSPQQIKFTTLAEQEALRCAEMLSRKYDGSIPVVEPAEQRIKLARLAGAVAALCYSTTDGEYLVIKPEHVLAAVKLLEWFLDDPACGYDDYSAAAKRANSLDDRDGLIKWCKRQSQETLLGLLSGPDIRRVDIENYSGLDREHAQTMFTYLLQRRAIVRNGNSYVKSRSFVGLLKEAVQKGYFVTTDYRETGKPAPSNAPTDY